jgi:hypothetical protein
MESIGKLIPERDKVFQNCVSCGGMAVGFVISESSAIMMEGLK